jgi:outer membrane protein OmpA-like peptidoglycan-associated protein
VIAADGAGAGDTASGGVRSSGGAASGPGSLAPGGTGIAGANASDAAASGTVVGMVDAPGGRARFSEDEQRPEALGKVLPLVIGIDEQGEFDFDQAVLRPEVRTLLDDLAEKLRDAEFDRLEITGHADRIGTPEYNQHLSDRRAWAVARYLMNKGVPLQKMHVAGVGERKPLTSAEECHDLVHDELIRCLQKDRRVEIDASVHRVHVRVEEGG